MKKIIISTLIILFSSTISYADYSNNPNCRGFGVLQTKERQICLEANSGLAKKERKKIIVDGKIALDTAGVRTKTGNMFKKLGVNTDSKLFKTGKYSEKK